MTDRNASERKVSQPEEPSTHLAKRQLRSELRTRRKERVLSDHEHRMAEHLLDVIGDLPKGNVAVYVAMPGEPPTELLRARLKKLGYRPLVPRVDGDDLQWAIDSEETTWETSPFGTAEPTNDFIDDQINALRGCVAVVVPAHAVDAHGLRLGQGKGFYDRALEFTRGSSQRPLLVSLTFEDEYLERVPHEPHDIPVDVSVTEETVRWFNTPD